MLVVTVSNECSSFLSLVPLHQSFAATLLLAMLASVVTAENTRNPIRRQYEKHELDEMRNELLAKREARQEKHQQNGMGFPKIKTNDPEMLAQLSRIKEQKIEMLQGMKREANGSGRRKLLEQRLEE